MKKNRSEWEEFAEAVEQFKKELYKELKPIIEPILDKFEKFLRGIGTK